MTTLTKGSNVRTCPIRQEEGWIENGTGASKLEVNESPSTSPNSTQNRSIVLIYRHLRCHRKTLSSSLWLRVLSLWKRPVPRDRGQVPSGMALPAWLTWIETYAFLSSRVIQTRITAPTNATAIDQIIPPLREIPNIPNTKPPTTPPSNPRM